MGRKRTSAAEDFIHLVARMPWWAGVVLALASWIVLHAIAGRPPNPAAFKPGQMAGPILQTMATGLAFAGQFLVPLLCLVAAAISFWQRRQRTDLMDTVIERPVPQTVQAMDWREFEMLVGEAFRLEGYRVLETGAAGPDGGVDLEVRRGGELYLVQCKQWRAFKVDVTVVRELYGVMAARGAAGGFVVTSGVFTEAAKEFAKGRNVKLVDGGVLLRMVTRVRSAMALSRAMRSAAATAGEDAEPTVPSALIPECPGCRGEMVKREARKGCTAGKSLWGCGRFPACRGTREIPV